MGKRNKHRGTEMDAGRGNLDDILGKVAAYDAQHGPVEDEDDVLGVASEGDAEEAVTEVAADQLYTQEPVGAVEIELDGSRDEEVHEVCAPELESGTEREVLRAPVDPDPLKPLEVSGVPEPTGVVDAQLRDAWDKMSQALRDHVKKAVTFQAQALRIPEWQLVCGLVAHLHASASLSNPQLDPAWMSSEPIRQSVAVCDYCGEEFVPRWRGQVYCGEECGRAVARMEYEEKASKMKAARREENMKLLEGIA